MNDISRDRSLLSLENFTEISSSEVELLLCCARTCIDLATKKRIELLVKQDIDWIHLIQIASYHGVMPLLYQNLKSIRSEAIPENVLARLRFNYQANDLRNHYLAEELIDILDKFEAEGILAVSFKGPLLSITAYDNLSFRQFSDLDIIVDKNDFIKAQKILNNLDFRALNDINFSDSFQEQLYFQEIDEFALIAHNKSIDIICDLHQAITVCHFRKCKIELPKLKDRLTYITLNKTKIHSIQPDYLLILLCIHASRHFWSQLNWICDINELINSHAETNWSKVLDEASLIGCKYHFLLGLYLSHYYLNTTIPQKIKAEIAASWRIKYLGKYIVKRMFASLEDMPGQGFNGSNLAYQILLTNGWQGYREILEYFILPTSKDKLAFNLPSWLSFLYYFLRPIRLFSQFVVREN